MTNIKNSFINLTDPAIFQTFGGEEYWEKVDVPTGQTVIQEGEASEDFYYIFSGAVEVKKALTGGASKTLATLEKGDFFGEGSLLSEANRGASVVAVTDAVLLKLSKESFAALVTADSQAAVGIILGIVKVLNARMQVANERLVALYNVSHLIREHAGQVQAIMPAIFNELQLRMGSTNVALYGMDGLVQFSAPEADAKVLERFQMGVPDFANRLSQAGAPNSMVDADLLYCSVRNLQGQMVGLLVAQVDAANAADEAKLFVTVAEQVGHLY